MFSLQNCNIYSIATCTKSHFSPPYSVRLRLRRMTASISPKRTYILLYYVQFLLRPAVNGAVELNCIFFFAFYFSLVYCLFHDLPIFFFLSNLSPSFTVSSSPVSLSIFLILLFSYTNCLPLRQRLPCHLGTFLFALSFRQG